MATKDAARTREALLLAAERLVLKSGLEHLTLDEVAAAASVSKGGLLHHFPNKLALVEGIVRRNLAIYDAEMERFRTEDPSEPGAVTRAMLRANLACPYDAAQICAVFAATAREYPTVAALVSEHATVLQRRLTDDGIDPVISSTIRYVADGILCSDMWRLPRAPNHDDVVRYLLRLAGGGNQLSTSNDIRHN